MIVCVDIGNTLTKAACVEDERVVARASTPTGADGYRGRVREALASLGGARDAVDGAVVSSVVPGATAEAAAALAAHTGTPPLVVSHRLSLPVELGVGHPERVGTDRLCAAAGAVDVASPDAVVVDVGSAVTVDLVQGRRFLGGVIMPGPAMMLDAMASRARQLPRIDLDTLPTLLPDAMGSTEESMALGAGLATLGGILEAVRRVSRQAPGAPVWVTGGAAARLDAWFPDDWRRDPDLCFRGLFRIARANLPSG